MTLHTETFTLSDGTRVTITSTRTPQQRARFVHLCKLFGCWELKPTGDGMTAQDWQAAQTAAAERAQRADDAALYNEGRDDFYGVGY